MLFDRVKSRTFIIVLTVEILLSLCVANANSHTIANWIISVLIGKVIPKHVYPMSTEEKITWKKKENPNQKFLNLLALFKSMEA